MWETIGEEFTDVSKYVCDKHTEVELENHRLVFHLAFLTPSFVVPKLAEFLGIATNKRISRVDITRLVCDYIRDNNLFDKDDRRFMVPDNKFSKCFNIKKAKISCFERQKYIQPFIVKPNWKTVAIQYKEIADDNHRGKCSDEEASDNDSE
jgi:chromatin remodeling complex protein RSC6